MSDEDRNQDLPESESPGQPAAPDPDLPDRLRVHSLARMLGTTSKRVVDALTEIDGRARSAHSTIDQAEAQRVREVLADELAAEAAAEPLPPESAMVIVASQETEPESRLILETGDAGAEPPAYLPLFVAPQAVAAEPRPAAADGQDDDDADDAEDADAEGGDRPAGRRRRRGRRGRGRGRGEHADDDGEETGEDADAGGESVAEDDEAGEEEAAGGEGGTRRRRRRRRRRGGSGDDADSSADDPPNTVVHERAPRAKKSDNNEIQGISGSTRLEAKRQRRRDGRDAGRRRPPVLTEAEFLARREAVDRVMVVRDKVRTEPPHAGARYTQIAVLEDGVVVEHFVTSAASASMVGNIYLGIVQNVLPSMEAAFIDIGRGRNGVLYAGEVNWEAAGLGGNNRKIEQALRPGDYVVVQVSKDPVGHKGARLTTQVSLAGRYLVYVPGASSTGISRKLPDTERQRLKEILREVVPADAGVIIRTASEGVKEDDIRADVNRLRERWSTIAEQAEKTKSKKAGAAVALYEEPDVLVKVVRDLFNEDFSGLIVSGDQAWETITGYVNSVAPELLTKLTKYEPAGPDVFAVYRIDEQLAKAMDRKVWLPSGGTLVIDRTEAMTVVDVNTGKFTGAGGNLEQTVTKNNLEAAEEIVRQLRLRDIGGIIVVDFIDMVLESNRDLVLRRLTEALARDRTRHQVSEVTSLGLVQVTRKRLGTGLIEAFSSTCPECSGRGILVRGEPVDHAPAAGRKSESGAGRRGKAEDAAVARVPAHVPGEHPMFKAMAAAKNGDEDGEEGIEGGVEDELAEDFTADIEEGEEAGAELVGELDEDDDDLEEDDEDEDDEDIELDDVDEDAIDDDAIEEDDTLEIVDEHDEDLDEDDDDLDEDDDDLDDDDHEDDEDDEDLDDEDDDEDDEDDDEDEVGGADPGPAARRPRRRAAARPAGPPAV
ncbi:MAG: translation initiation factor IF-2 N-terminal domain-containing protein [Mycobacterium sp.]